MKLLEFQKKVNSIKKDGKNPHFKSTYATLTQILSEVKPVLSECGLLVTQPIKDNRVSTIISDDKGVLAESYIDLPTNLTPQQLGSAITYFRRYTLASLLALEIADDDSNIATIQPPKKAQMTDVILSDMLKFIAEGKKDIVLKSISKYDASPIQMEVINKAIANVQ
jgi:hypothetical protein